MAVATATRKSSRRNGAARKTPRRAGEPTYTAADIQVLEGVQAIRRRPGMYIGSTATSGLLHLLWEAIDNACDEYSAGFGKRVSVTIDRAERVTVRDNARGMPFDLMKVNGKRLPAVRRCSSRCRTPEASSRRASTKPPVGCTASVPRSSAPSPASWR